MKDLAKSSLDTADKLLNLPHRELLAHSLQDDGRWRDNYQMSIIIKNQKTNEKLVLATEFLAVATVILLGLTLYLQYIR
ncbi:hypothetical protein HN876_01395 [archaeon]|jgi:hypothetical protein|nr:hypothetical protein [archaeon]MBT6182297.1 hypothetical protein [archaeon]MBT6606280.1 hypothetical protein [archaeon]MBT7251551.1 hypothetical protein [archaeon]